MEKGVVTGRQMTGWTMTTTPSPSPAPAFVSRRRDLERRIAELHRCSDLRHLRQVHAQLLRRHLHLHPNVAPKLLSSLSLCNQLSSLLPAFLLVPTPDAALFNALIRSFAAHSLPGPAFAAFARMRSAALPPDPFTYSSLLKAACFAAPGSAARFAAPGSAARMLHAHLVKLGFLSEIRATNSLIDCYAKCGGDGGIDDARKVFDGMRERDVVSWNTMIAVLAKCGKMWEARRLFDGMPEKDAVSWNAIVDGYAKAGEVETAYELFKGMPGRNVVSWSTMILGFSKAGDMDMARILFDTMPAKNLIAWAIIISGYAEKGMGKEATDMYDQFQKSGLVVDAATVVSIVAACAESGLLELGTRMHSYVNRTDMRHNAQVCNSLIDMYAKAGVLHKAMQVFSRMARRDVVSWNIMIQGLAAHGNGRRALQFFYRMMDEGLRPDNVTFLGVLSACGHSGLVDEARHYFTNMERDYGVVPMIEHYGCMIDLLGRRGDLKEAFGLARSMPMKLNAIILGALLNACRMHNNVELAETAVDWLTQVGLSDAGNLAVMSNIYASAGRWPEVAKLRLQLKAAGKEKAGGSSFLEVDNLVHEFTVGDRSHTQSYRIYRMIDKLGHHLKQAGCVPKAFV